MRDFDLRQLRTKFTHPFMLPKASAYRVWGFPGWFPFSLTSKVTNGMTGIIANAVRSRQTLGWMLRNLMMTIQRTNLST